ncbi:MAG: hypothetical protein LBP76_07715 [Treponema sp.]|jgi:hypothetical protein|nr:hypothetical protein [Treponema sp.]
MEQKKQQEKSGKKRWMVLPTLALAGVMATASLVGCGNLVGTDPDQGSPNNPSNPNDPNNPNNQDPTKPETRTIQKETIWVFYDDNPNTDSRVQWFEKEDNPSILQEMMQEKRVIREFVVETDETISLTDDLLPGGGRITRYTPTGREIDRDAEKPAPIFPEPGQPVEEIPTDEITTPPSLSVPTHYYLPGGTLEAFKNRTDVGVVSKIVSSDHSVTELYEGAPSSIRQILTALSQQAADIEQYIMSIRNQGEDASIILNQLQAYEDQIRQGKAAADSNITLNNFLANMDTVGEGIRGLLRGKMDGESATSFDKYFNAHQKLNYLITRDWKMAADGELETARTGYISARTASGIGDGGRTGTYNNLRGTTISEIGVNPSAQAGAYRDGIRPLVLEVLGLSVSNPDTPLGVLQTESLKAFVDALITQMGDCEELRAFKDDVAVTERIAGGLNYVPDTDVVAPLPVGTPATVAQAAE